jgi:hypothetical protein
VTDEAWAVWAVVLDRLEADLALAEHLADDPTAESPARWEAPTVDSPIPAGLVDRAHDVLTRQQRVQEALAASLTATSRQQDFTSRVDRATARTEQAVYLDVSA